MRISGALRYVVLLLALFTVPAESASDLSPSNSPDPLQSVAAAPSDTVRFGRQGSLTDRELAMAKAAWQYFVVAYQDSTGLVNSVGSYPSTTMWDTASYISGLVAAHELGIIDKREFDGRAYKLIGTLRNLNLFGREMPNKVYNTETAAKVDYANKPGEVGFSALDIGRLLVWLRIMGERYPYLSTAIDNIPLRWNFCNAIDAKGRLVGANVDDKGATKYFQEGRLGYAEYAAKGFGLWGFDTRSTIDGAPVDFVDIYGVQVPVDRRDRRVFGTANYVLTESYVLDGIELGWDLPEDRSSPPGVASQGWRVEFANRVYLAQQRRYEQTGILTARSEHQVEGAPYFVYDSVFSDGYAWNTLDPSGAFQPDRAAVAAKAALGLWVLWDTPYTDLLFETIADLYSPEKGFDEGLYENGNGAIPLQTANNNGIILAALLYKVEGPLLKYGAQRPRYWDVAFPDMDVRSIRCLPPAADQTVTQDPCDCEEETSVRPMLKPEEFEFCASFEHNGLVAGHLCTVPAMSPVVSNARPDVYADGRVCIPSDVWTDTKAGP